MYKRWAEYNLLLLVICLLLQTILNVLTLQNWYQQCNGVRTMLDQTIIVYLKSRKHFVAYCFSNSSNYQNWVKTNDFSQKIPSLRKVHSSAIVTCDVRKGSWDNNKVLTCRDLSQELHEKNTRTGGWGTRKRLLTFLQIGS